MKVKGCIPIISLCLLLQCLLVAIFVHRNSQPENESNSRTPYEEIEIDRHVFKNTNITEDVDRNLELEKLFYSYPKHQVNNFSYQYYITPHGRICPSNIHLIIVVESRTKHHERRDAIRRTWGRISKGLVWPNGVIKNKVGVVFAMGKSQDEMWNNFVVLENEMYNDIIGGDFNDSGDNAVLVSLLGLKWVSENCTGAVHMLKCSDDTLINIPYLLKILQRDSLYHSLLGVVTPKYKVIRKGQIHITYKIYPLHYFPPHLAGAAYVISFDLIQPLFNASQYFYYIPFSDLYITGILAKVVGAKLVDNKEMGIVRKKLKPCDIILNHVLARNGLSPSYMYEIWMQIYNKFIGMCGDG